MLMLTAGGTKPGDQRADADRAQTPRCHWSGSPGRRPALL